MFNLLVKCSYSFKGYDDLYQRLKESEYGQSLNKTFKICDHNALYYYGLCEQVLGVNLENGNSTLDCSGADCYTRQREIDLQSRASSYFDPSVASSPRQNFHN
jgi:hypothetical protein